MQHLVLSFCTPTTKTDVLIGSRKCAEAGISSVQKPFVHYLPLCPDEITVGAGSVQLTLFN